MSHFEDPYINFGKSEIWQELVDPELQKWINSLPPEESKQLQSDVVEAIASSLERANELPPNQAGQTEALLGKYNFILHKFCLGALKITYSVIKEIVKAKTGSIHIDPKEGASFLKAVWDVYGSIETPNTDEWAIIEVIEIFNFRKDGRILTEPGPTVKEIENELEKKGLRYDNLPTKLVDMRNRTILSEDTVDGKTYYQIKYVSEMINGDN